MLQKGSVRSCSFCTKQFQSEWRWNQWLFWYSMLWNSAWREDWSIWQMGFSALANPDYFFYRYSASHHSLAPSDTLPDVAFQVNHRDTIFVEFRPVFRPQLTFLSSPPGACAIKLNGVLLTNNLFQQDFTLGEPVTLDYESLGNKYLFDRWFSRHHDLLPDSVHVTVSFNIIKNANIIL